jgi:anti-sigma-K factor RskA
VAPQRGLSLGWGWLSGALGLGLAAALAWGWQQHEGRSRDSNRLREQLVAQSSALAQARAELASITRVGYVAVLADAKTGPALLVTFDPATRKLGVKRVGSYQEAQEKSLQLWTIAPGQAPKSLGVLSRAARERLQAEALEDVSEPRVLAISLEPLGGVPSERGPTGPVLFTGPVLKADV